MQHVFQPQLPQIMRVSVFDLQVALLPPLVGRHEPGNLYWIDLPRFCCLKPQQGFGEPLALTRPHAQPHWPLSE
jgi:hypothetical protein